MARVKWIGLGQTPTRTSTEYKTEVELLIHDLCLNQWWLKNLFNLWDVFSVICLFSRHLTPLHKRTHKHPHTQTFLGLSLGLLRAEMPNNSFNVNCALEIIQKNTALF